jgi:hypothetical protein
VPKATVVARAAASSEQGNPASPLDDGGNDNVIQGNITGSVRANLDASGCIDGAHVLSFAACSRGAGTSFPQLLIDPASSLWRLHSGW